MLPATAAIPSAARITNPDALPGLGVAGGGEDHVARAADVLEAQAAMPDACAEGVGEGGESCLDLRDAGSPARFSSS